MEWLKMNEVIYNFKNGLVSIIVPCYNGEPFLFRLLDSICKQTYTHIQLIFVNDGSTDGTEKVFGSYVSLFQQISIKYSYIKQENSGQAEAINAALPYVEGEYLMWIDADDYLSEDHVGKKVECLNSHQDVSIVCCRGVLVEDKNTECIVGYLDNRHITEKLFENLLFEQARCANGLYMVRTRALFAVLQNRRISPSEVGQNLQLLLPLSYKSQTYYMDDILFYCVVRSDSHSHKISGIIQWCKRFNEIKELKLQILHEMEEIMPRKYNRLLCRLVCLQEICQKINMILDNNIHEEGEKLCIKREVEELYKHFAYKGEGRQYWIWGFCDRSRKLKQYLKQYAGTEITGFIDSDEAKWNGMDVISPQDINADKMYLIILLHHYPDIVKWLYAYSFQEKRDFFYPEFEIDTSIKTY